jgi:RimJ/RimL family protein N-acetyltransferase
VKPPTPTLETGRLILRPFTEDDAAAVLAVNAHPEVTRYTGDGPFADVEAARAMIRSRTLADYAKHGFGRWACLEKASGELIGFCGLKYLEGLSEVDLGYRLVPRCWGRGLATEGALASIDYGFRVLGLPRVLGLVHPENARSVRVLEKCGFTLDGELEYYGAPTLRYVLPAPADAHQPRPIADIS